MRTHWLTIAALLSCGTSGWAQTPAERAALGQFRVDLERGTTTGRRQEDCRSNTGDKRAGTLCQLRTAYAALHLGGLSNRESDLLSALNLFTQLIDRQPEWPEVWLGLGLSRLAMYDRGFLAHEGPLQPAGMSYAGGAQRALVRALELDPTFTEAARSLGESPAIVPSEQAGSAALAVLRRATTGDDSVPALLLGRARWESAAGHSDSAIAVLGRYLGAGGDTAIGSFYLTRQLFRTGEASRAIDAYFLGAAHADSDTARKLYRQDIAWIATEAELHAFDSVAPTPGLAQWLRMFWERRDAADNRPAGSRLTEHYRRYEYALGHYRIFPLRNVSRSRVLTGASDPGPGEGETPETGSTGATEAASGIVSEPTWGAEWGRVVGGSGPFREYRPTQSILDDRGVIYLRHGAPDQIAFAVGGVEVLANVSWKYSRPEGDLIFHFMDADFDGSAGPTVLVAGLSGKQLLQARCGFDTELCLLGMQSRATPEERVRQRDRARADIRTGTTTDRFPRKFKAALEARVQVYGLLPDGNGKRAPLLVVFAIPGGHLRPDEGQEDGARTLYRVRVQVLAFNEATGERFSLDTVRNFRTPHQLGGGEFLSELTEMPVPAGQYLVTAVLSQDGDARGSGARADMVRVASATPSLAMSDVILGRQGSGLTWHHTGLEVPLNPLTAFTKGDVAEVFYAAAGMLPGDRYSVQLSVARADSPKKSLLSLQFEENATATSAVSQRRIELRSLGPGDYWLRVVLRSVRTGGQVERTAALSIRDH